MPGLRVFVIENAGGFLQCRSFSVMQSAWEVRAFAGRQPHHATAAAGFAGMKATLRASPQRKAERNG
jgi:hypothetical protein